MGSRELIVDFEEIAGCEEEFSEELFNIGRASNVDVPVNNGFLLSREFFSEFFGDESFENVLKDIRRDYDSLDPVSLNKRYEVLRSRIMDRDMPENLEEKLVARYKDLESSVGVDRPEVELVINIYDGRDFVFNAQGSRSIIRGVKRCYKEYFSNRVLDKIVENDVSFDSFFQPVKISWNVQEDLSGRALSSLERDENGNIVQIEIENDSEEFDELYVFKKDLSLIKDDNFDLSNIGFRENQVKKLAKYVYKLEKEFESCLDVSWCFDKDSKQLYFTGIEQLEREKDLLRVEFLEDVDRILNGDGLGSEVVGGRVQKLDSPRQIDKVDSDTILVTDNLSEEWREPVSRAKAVISNRDQNSFIKNISRDKEQNIITNTEKATSCLENGEKVTIDAINGEVVRGEPEYEIKRINSDGNQLKDLNAYLNISSLQEGLDASKNQFEGAHLTSEFLNEKLISELGLIVRAFHPRNVFLHLDSRESLEKQEEILEKIEKVYENGLENINIVIYSQPSISSVKESKRELKEDLGFKDFDILLGIDKPIIKDYFEDIDGLFDGYVLNFDSFASNMLGVSDLAGFFEENQEFLEEELIDFARSLPGEDDVLLYSEDGFVTQQVFERFSGFSGSLEFYFRFLEDFDWEEKNFGRELDFDVSLEISSVAEELENNLVPGDVYSKENLLEELDDEMDLDLLNQALGWLAKDNKIEGVTREGKVLYKKSE